MIEMNKIIFDDKNHYFTVANLIKNAINEINKNEVLLGLPGGRSIGPVLEKLKKEKIDWEKIHIFLIDERRCPINNKESNFRLIKESLDGAVKKENLHPFIIGSLDIKNYEEELKEFGRSYDISVLSSGEDGHIASLYPNHPSIMDESRYFIDVKNSPKPPPNRISISKNMLLRSKIGILMFFGESKINAYKNFLDSKIDYTKCPAKLVKDITKHHIITNLKI